ncbi:uncharacterized protein LOC133039777 [Cannabis sativa]|uniref:uncharacterized protein LOC133039777 n=1 Tax=Cannabis sativa TaxID=3483 RepID=UPI0029CA14F6|nr:uncharacterized protein LOC133039777 [Cannabis sativa]
MVNDNTMKEIVDADPNIIQFQTNKPHYGGLFYAIINDGTLRSFDLRSPCVDSTVRELAREIPLLHLGLKRYLVESYGHIILVERFFRWDIKDEIRRTWRYCMESNNWIHMKSLGEMALFVGDNSSVSVLATRFNGIQPNCIYFTHDEDVICGSSIPMIFDVGLYDLENDEFKLHSATLNKMNRRPPIWLLPTL